MYLSRIMSGYKFIILLLFQVLLTTRKILVPSVTTATVESSNLSPVRPVHSKTRLVLKQWTTVMHVRRASSVREMALDFRYRVITERSVRMRLLTHNSVKLGSTVRLPLRRSLVRPDITVRSRVRTRFHVRLVIIVLGIVIVRCLQVDLFHPSSVHWVSTFADLIINDSYNNIRVYLGNQS